MEGGNQHESLLYEKLDNNKVKCRACSHYCILKENDLSLCNVKKNLNGVLTSLVNNKPVALNIDPIEKNLFFIFYLDLFLYL